MSVSSKKYDAVIAGYTCVDMVPSFLNESKGEISDLLKPGKLIEIGGMEIVLGGVVPNTGLLMKHFGNNVSLNGLIGDDLIGKIAEECLNQYEASGGIAKTTEAGTAYSIVIAPPNVDRIFLESPGCNQNFNTEHINFSIVVESRLFHFGYPPLLQQFYLGNGAQLAKMYCKVNQMGVVTSLDFSLPDPESESGKINWLQVLHNTLPFVDIFVPSLEELFFLVEPKKYARIQSMNYDVDFESRVSLSSIRELADKVIGLGVGILLIKMGKRGIYLKTGDVSSVNTKLGNTLTLNYWNNREILCDAYSTEASRIINASGAGDTAIAAFLTAILKAENPEEAIKYAAIAGRDSLYYENIFESMSSWETITHEMNVESNELTFLENEK